MKQVLDWELLLAEDCPWACFAVCPEEHIDRFVQSAQMERGIIARIIRGRRCSSVEALFQEWAAALQFPYYFGNNWDAFEECISDLEWLSGRAFVIFITQVERVLPSLNREFRMLLEILQSSVADLRSREGREDCGRGSGTHLRFVFHSHHEHASAARERLAGAGLLDL